MSDITIHSEADDRALVDAVIASLAKPKSFVSYDTKFSTDSSGEDATWITVRVDDSKAMSSSATFKALQNFVNAVSQQLLVRGVSRWPYIMLVSAKEPEERATSDRRTSKQHTPSRHVLKRPAKKAAKKNPAKKATKKATKKAAKKATKRSAKK